MVPKKDVFICHAGEDKQAVVRPIATAFDAANISYWLDEAEILWADSITEKVNEGLKISRYVIVVLSAAFLKKSWPQREFYAALNLEAGSGEVRVLPLLVGDRETQQEVLDKYPLINDKAYIVWDGTALSVVSALQKRLGKFNGNNSNSATIPATPSNSESNIYIPPIKRNSTQRDKDLFLQQTFATVKSYFQEALKQFEQSYPEIETLFTEIHTQKFVCKIYVNGAVGNQCRVWIGDNAFIANGLAYAEGKQLMDHDSGMNEIATIDETPKGLTFSLMMSSYSGDKTKALNPEELAAALWKRFATPLVRS